MTRRRSKTKAKAQKREHDLIKAGRKEALEAQNGFCRYCYAPISEEEATADHRIPRSKGGSNLAHNIDALCSPCNNAKGHMNPGIFLKEIKNPSPGSPLPLLLSWSRRKIWLKTHRACRYIGEMAGFEPHIPNSMRKNHAENQIHY